MIDGEEAGLGIENTNVEIAISIFLDYLRPNDFVNISN